MNTHKMHEDEVEINVSLVSQLVTTQVPQYADFSIKPFASTGTDNAIFRLGHDMAIRLPRIKKAANHIEKEYEWLPKLAPLLPLQIPVPLKKGTADESYPYPWYIYRWLEGINATTEKIDFYQAANDLGEFISALQKVDITDAPQSRRGLPLSSRDKETREAIMLLKDTFDPNQVTKIWEKALAVPLWQEDPVWIHGDLLPSNMLVKNGKLSAIIDFGTSGIGDPACDMMVAWTFFNAETRDVFREKINVDDATWERGRGWALTFGLVALPYYEKTNPELVGIAKRTIDEVLIDK